MNNSNIIFIVALILLYSCKESTIQDTMEELNKGFTIYTIGDSTMANKPNPNENPERGWGQMLHLFFNDTIIINNYAVNGRSTRSFRNLKHWSKVYDSLEDGDYVFIQFGHNDSKIKDSSRYTNPHTTFRHNLIRYVDETRAKGAHPILLSSIVRRKFNKYGVLLDTHGDYTLVTRLVAQEMEVPFIDLQYLTQVMEETYGPKGSLQLHLHYKAGEHPYYPEGIQDNTHLSVVGATNIAKMVSEELIRLTHPLAKYIIR
ncbi:rhamnogalacturonan acetylesterase [Aquimarina sp. W85]|uniref:rhamnogalacturonan acetylesterase n=1 Tax=Aquimarina rhodophyticola TaxID=3342246 RepID=UPI0036719461